MLTPENVHYNQHPEILNARSVGLMHAYMEHPERFVRGIPEVKQVPKEVWINKPNVKELAAEPVC
jgi:putative transposase